MNIKLATVVLLGSMLGACAAPGPKAGSDRADDTTAQSKDKQDKKREEGLLRFPASEDIDRSAQSVDRLIGR